MSTELLTTYLQDHHAAAAAGVDLFNRIADSHGHPEVRTVVATLAEEVADDKVQLEELMSLVGAKTTPAKDLLARAGEKIGQLKPNQRIVSRSPLSDLLELEALTVAVRAKTLGWRALDILADPRLPQNALQNLIKRASRQEEELERLRRSCVDVLKSS